MSLTTLLLLISVMALLGKSDDVDKIVSRCYETALRRYCFVTPSWHTAWNWAQGWCTKNSAALAVIDSKEVQDSIEQFIAFSGLSNNIWIGANFHEGDWTWVDGRTYAGKALERKSVTDDSWTAALVVDSSGPQFSAQSPTQELPFICQFVEGSWCDAPSSHHSSRDGVCYVKHDDMAATWFKARNVCLRENGDLAVFTDLSETSTKWLTVGKTYWVGLRTSWWTWQNGADVKYSYWSTGRPKNAPALRCLILDMKNPWRWSNADCSDQSNEFVCRAVVSSFNGTPVVILVLFALILALAVLLNANRRRKILDCVQNTISSSRRRQYERDGRR